jgi:uncharacterized protein (TIGR02271 family)
MSRGACAIVNGKDGLHGTVEVPDDLSEGDVRALVHLQAGRDVLVPADALIPQSDGSYYLPLSVEDLGRAAPPPTTTSPRPEGPPGMQQGHNVETAQGAIVVPVIEETLRVDKKDVETGRLRITKTVSEREEVVSQPLVHEEVRVERVPIERMIEGPVPVRTEGDTTIVPVIEEVLVVEKRLRLKEEVRITRHRSQKTSPERVTLRREEVNIERVESPQKP